jgi:hypothetical protein
MEFPEYVFTGARQNGPSFSQLNKGIAAMTEPTIRFPVNCPKCGREELGEYSVAEVAAVLLAPNTTALRLYAPCHEYHWNARPGELAQIREYFREWMKYQPPSLNASHQRE